MIGSGLDLALRLAVGTDRGSRVRLSLITAGVALAVAMLLGVTGVMPAAWDRAGKPSGRGVIFGEHDAQRTEGVRTDLSVGFWHGRETRLMRVELVGPPVPPPAGVPRIPGPGQVFVSPALADALAGAHRAELTARLPGEVVGRIGRGGLVGPEELFAIAGAPAGVVQGDLSSGFEAAGDPGLAVNDGTGMRAESSPPEETWVAVLLAGVGLLVPMVVLVGTLTRLSAASRERRASALRLIGATGRQLRMIGAVEGAIVGVGGAAGAGLFFLLRGPAAALFPLKDGIWASEVQPPWIALLLVLLGVPALTAASGGIAVRRALATPLGVHRQGNPRRAGVSRLLPLALGLALIVGAYADRRAVLHGSWHGMGLLLSGAALCLIGVAIAGPALTRTAGTVLARWGPGTASQLAGRRLVMDPTSSARAVTGMALVVIVIGSALAFLPLLAGTGLGSGAESARSLRAGTVAVSLDGRADVTEPLRTLTAIHGVRGVVAISDALLLPARAPAAGEAVALGTPVPGNQPIVAVIADCSKLANVLLTPLHDCRPGTMQYLGSDSFNASTVSAAHKLQLVTYDDHTRRYLASGATINPTGLSSLQLPDGLSSSYSGFSISGDVLIPPANIGDDMPVTKILVATDGRPETAEEVRTTLGTARTIFAPVTPAEAISRVRTTKDGYIRAALLAALTVVFVGGISLAVTTADSLRERRRAHAALTALGTPVAVLRRSVLLQTALPLILNVGLAVLVAASTSRLYLRLGDPDQPPPLPWAGYGAIALAAVTACLLATAAALPFVRSAARPDTLRTE